LVQQIDFSHRFQKGKVIYNPVNSPCDGRVILSIDREWVVGVGPVFLEVGFDFGFPGTLAHIFFNCLLLLPILLNSFSLEASCEHEWGTTNHRQCIREYWEKVKMGERGSIILFMMSLSIARIIYIHTRPT
jgi:hypothetical protein